MARYLSKSKLIDALLKKARESAERYTRSWPEYTNYDDPDFNEIWNRIGSKRDRKKEIASRNKRDITELLGSYKDPSDSWKPDLIKSFQETVQHAINIKGFVALNFLPYKLNEIKFRNEFTFRLDTIVNGVLQSQTLASLREPQVNSRITHVHEDDHVLPG